MIIGYFDVKRRYLTFPVLSVLLHDNDTVGTNVTHFVSVFRESKMGGKM